MRQPKQPNLDECTIYAVRSGRLETCIACLTDFLLDHPFVAPSDAYVTRHGHGWEGGLVSLIDLRTRYTEYWQNVVMNDRRAILAMVKRNIKKLAIPKKG